MEQNENTLSVLKIAPGQYPQQVEIDNDLKALQQAVGGSIGASYPFEDSVAIVYNDDGKLMGLPLNRALWDEDGLMYDVIAGTFLVVGLGEEDFASLSPELAQKYEEEFHQPEAFLPLGRRLMVIPVPDESIRSDTQFNSTVSIDDGSASVPPLTVVIEALVQPMLTFFRPLSMSKSSVAPFAVLYRPPKSRYSSISP